MKTASSLLALGFSAFLISCASQEAVDAPVADAAATPVVEIAPAKIMSADAVYSNGAYTLHWTSSAKAAPVEVYVASAPYGDDAVMIADDILDGSLTWTPEDDANSRRYFILAPVGGEPAVTATRLLPLEGGRNFRDLGGYTTVDGETVKWGTLFRSGVMTNLTAGDYEYLSGLGINVVCDLRTSDERNEAPTEWKAGEISYQTFPDPAEDGAESLGAVFRDPDVTPEKVSAMMANYYPAILEQQQPAYTAMFDEIANGALPLAFNCSAGKDRTGIGAALILSTLGVPRDTVVADYAMSEKVVDYMKEFKITTDDEIEEDSPYAFLRKLPPELVTPLMRSDPLYINKVLDEIDAEYGDVVTYVQAELDVDDEELTRIRERLLVK